MEDLTHMLTPGTQFNAGESMSAGNTVTLGTAEVAMAGHGTAPVNPNPKLGSATDTPAMEIPPVSSYTKKVN